MLIRLILTLFIPVTRAFHIEERQQNDQLGGHNTHHNSYQEKQMYLSFLLTILVLEILVAMAMTQ